MMKWPRCPAVEWCGWALANTVDTLGNSLVSQYAAHQLPRAADAQVDQTIRGSQTESINQHMSNSLIREWLDLWYELLEEPSVRRFKTPNDMAGVLADLRRDPDRLARAFAPLPCGDALLTRVKRCIDAEKQHDSLYLIPSPLEATDNELRSLVVDAITRGCQCCGMDVPDYPINIVRRAMTGAESVDAAPLVEELGDLYLECGDPTRERESQAMQFLNETLYTLAASFEVLGYCLTPLCPEEIRRVDPYEPQIQLWLRGAHAVVRWNDDADDYWVDVFVE